MVPSTKKHIHPEWRDNRDNIVFKLLKFHFTYFFKNNYKLYFEKKNVVGYSRSNITSLYNEWKLDLLFCNKFVQKFNKNISQLTHLMFILWVTKPNLVSSIKAVARSSLSDSSLGVMAVGCLRFKWRWPESTTILTPSLCK